MNVGDATFRFVDALSDAHHWMMVGTTVGVVSLAVLLHADVLERINEKLPNTRLPPRYRMLVVLLLILIMHGVEIWIFAAGIMIGAEIQGPGAISGTDDLMFLDAIYLSALTYTTLGYGDLVPHGAMRLMLGSEALVGFVMITWSASFSYLVMQTNWRQR